MINLTEGQTAQLTVVVTNASVQHGVQIPIILQSISMTVQALDGTQLVTPWPIDGPISMAAGETKTLQGNIAVPTFDGDADIPCKIRIQVKGPDPTQAVLQTFYVDATIVQVWVPSYSFNLTVS